MAEPVSLIEPTLLTREQAAKLVGMSPAWVTLAVRQGRFPPALKITPGMQGAVRWERVALDEWVARLRRERNKRPSPTAEQAECVLAQKEASAKTPISLAVAECEKAQGAIRSGY